MVCQWENCNDLNEEHSHFCYAHNEMIREQIRNDPEEIQLQKERDRRFFYNEDE